MTYYLLKFWIFRALFLFHVVGIIQHFKPKVEKQNGDYDIGDEFWKQFRKDFAKDGAENRHDGQGSIRT